MTTFGVILLMFEELHLVQQPSNLNHPPLSNQAHHLLQSHSPAAKGLVPGAIRHLLPVTVCHFCHLFVSATLHLLSYWEHPTTMSSSARSSGVSGVTTEADFSWITWEMLLKEAGIEGEEAGVKDLTDDMRSSALVYNIVAESSKFVVESSKVGLKNYLGEELASKLFEAISKFRTTSLKRKHVQDNCPTPSALGVKSEWCANQKKYAVFCHRPASNTHKLHVSLQVAAFGNFLQELKEGEPDVHCIKIAQGLMLEMSDVFKNEGDRLETFSKIMTNLFRDFNVLSVSWGSAPNANTDLSVLAENNVLINFKLKNELSEGGKEANLQNIGYYIHLQKKYTLSNEPAPMLLVSLVGCHYIQVFGAAWNNNGVCVDPLSPPVSLLFVPEDPNNGIRTMAQMLTALLHGAQDLKIHYSLPDEQRCRCKWPYFDMNGRLQYIKQDSQKCRLFEAMCNEQKCVVKFVSSHYGTDVQQYLAQKNLAPQIISHTQLSGGWNAVVMEKVDGNKFPVEPTQTQKKSLLDAVDYLHLGGYVHGDLRPQNIMVLPDDTVRIVDFDWAGRAGHAKYPLDINISASHNWHSGVAYGGYIQKEHDKYQIARY